MGHHHNHGHSHHDHHHAPKSFNLAFALAVGLNFGFTIIEAIYAILANSMGLLADAGHNLGDVLGLLFAWGASWLLTLPATERYSYGYKRTSILAAIINALFLVATCAIIAYESIIKIMQPAPINEMMVIVVAAIGIVINGSTALLFMRGQKEDLNIKGAFLHLASDALISLGVVIAGFIVLKTGKFWIDPIVGILIVIAILISTWGLLRHSIDLILDAVPHGINRAGVTDYLMQVDGVTKIHDLHIWGLSTNEVALTAHLIVPRGNFTDALYAKINDDLLHTFKIHHVTIQVETGEGIPCSQEASC
jgi:cobalt-zinc-cadmium efflux system protein